MKKIYLLFIMFLAISGCQKDEIAPAEENVPSEITENGGITIKMLGANEINRNKHLLTALNIFKAHNKLAQSKEMINSGYGFTINTDVAKYIEKGEYHSFSFPVSRENGSGNIENLLLSLNSNGGYNVYLVQYGFNREELKTMDKEAISATTTQMTPIDFDYSTIIGNSTYKRMSHICVEKWVQVCSENSDHTQSTCSDWDRYAEWVLTSRECTWISSGGDGGTPGDPGDTGDGSGGGGSGSGGGDGDSDCNTLKKTEPCGDDPVIVTGPVVSSTAEMLTTILNLTDNDQILWLETHDAKAWDLFEFVRDNEYSNEAKDFANAAIDAFVNGGEVDLVYKLIIDISVDEFVKDIINDLKNDNLNFRLVPDITGTNMNLAPFILNTFAAQKDHNLIIKQGDLPPNDEGLELNAKTLPQPPPPGSGSTTFTYTITLNNDFVDHATDLAIARTIIHEALHAYISYMYQDQFFSSFAQAYQYHIDQFEPGTPPNPIQHQYMLQFAAAMAKSLGIWDNFGLGTTSPYYLYLSYSGAMTQTSFFLGLNSNFQQSCINANIAEGQATNPATSDALGTKNSPR